VTLGVPLAGTIYFIRQVGTTTPIKIGASRRSGLQRLTDFQPGCPVPLELAGCFAGNCRDEKALHHQFAANRLHGEWFKYHPDMEQYLGVFGGVMPPPCWLEQFGHTQKMYRKGLVCSQPEDQEPEGEDA